MRVKSAANAARSTRKRASRKGSKILANCPINGAGWCPYPFSPEQLEKRLKKQNNTSQAQEEELVGAGGRGKNK